MLKSLLALALIYVSASAFSQENDAELVFHDTNISLKNGRLYTNVAFELNINNRDGERFTNFSIPYSKLVKISKLEAYVRDKSGTIIKRLQKGDITDKSAISDASLYQDDFVKEFTLKHNSYPYRIFCSYVLQEEEFLNIIYWSPVIDRMIPTLQAVLNVEIPEGYKISFRSQFTDSFTTDTTELGIKYTWSASYREIKEPEILSPSVESFLPRVSIVPNKFKYEIPGSFDTWLTYGNWNYELIKGLSTLPPYEINNIHKLIGGITDKNEIVKILYHYLQDHTRYINIQIETGGYKPFPASYVAENKYGDCKALSNYFKALLEVAGIQSYYAKVWAGNPIIPILKDLPSPQFNHIIICVPGQMDTVWLDCTSDLPFNHLGTFTQDRDVFIIVENNSHFTRTPALSKDDVVESRRVRIHQDIKNQAIIEFHNTYSGEKYESFLNLAHSVNNSDMSQIFRNNFVEDGIELIDFKIADPERDSYRISVSYSGKSNRVYKNYGNDVMIDVLSFSFPRLEDPGKRILPVEIDYPVYKIDTLEYELPEGYSLDSPLFKQTITTEFGRYAIESVQKGNLIEIVKSYLLYSGIYSIDRYKDFYTFISKISGIEKNHKIVTSK